MLSLAVLKVQLMFTTPVDLPYWMGSTFRGGLGIHLRKACCPDLQEDCYRCDGRGDCLFYHTHMKRTSRRGRGPPPKPVVVVPPFFARGMHVEQDGSLDLDVILMGKFVRYLPHVVLGLRLLGQAGIGATRHYGSGRYRIDGIRCRFSGSEIFRTGNLDLEGLEVRDIQEMPPAAFEPVLRVGFRTPFIAKTGEFPPFIDRLLWHIRQRVIYYVNEYGDGGVVPDYSVKGRTLTSRVHFHRLIRASARAGKGMFYGYTGVVDYGIEEMDRNAAWLLSIGSLLGAGPKASFGCGYIQIGLPEPKLQGAILDDDIENFE